MEELGWLVLDLEFVVLILTSHLQIDNGNVDLALLVVGDGNGRSRVLYAGLLPVLDLDHLVKLRSNSVGVVLLHNDYLGCLLLDGVAIIIELFFFVLFIFFVLILGLLFLWVDFGLLLNLSVVRIIDVVNLDDSVGVLVGTPDAKVSVLAASSEVLVVVL